MVKVHLYGKGSFEHVVVLGDAGYIPRPTD